MSVLNDRNSNSITRAERMSLLIDGDAYFRAARKAILEARQTVHILGWDVNSHVRMLREPPYDDAPEQFADFLWHALEKNPDLHIYLLLWDYSMIYIAEREWNPFSHFKRNKHPRLHFQTDNFLPLGSSHHQKILAVDDALAFVGGLDFSVWRWDTAEHHFDHPERIDTRGKPYNPYHDTTLLVSGPVARELADLCRKRWLDATGESIERPSEEPRIAWPPSIEPNFEDTQVAISLTQTRHQDREELLQVEQMTLDSIDAAHDFLYIENQYLSSHRIGKALEARLKEEDGPEIVILLTADTQGWTEENTMGLLRDRILERLDATDEHDRLRIYTPYVIQDGERKQVYVHAKLHIVDNRILKVGSSNLSNRSMRVDSECDLVLEYDEPSVEINQCLCRLLSKYFACSPDEVDEGIREAGGIGKWIDSRMQEDGHTLRPFHFGLKSSWDRKLADTQLLDPDEPLDLVHWASKHMPATFRSKLFQRSMALAALLLAALLVFAFLHYGGENIPSGKGLLQRIEVYQDSIHIWWMIPAVFLIAATFGAPLNAMLVLGTLTFGALPTFIGGFVGAYASSHIGFLAGRWGGTPLVNRFGNRYTDRLNEFLRERGLLPVFLLRILPAAPFPMINLVAGSTSLPWRTYNLGTLLGMFPGMLVTVLITHQSQRMILEPNLMDLLLLVLIVGVTLSAFFALRKSWRIRRDAQK